MRADSKFRKCWHVLNKSLLFSIYVQKPVSFYISAFHFFEQVNVNKNDQSNEAHSVKFDLRSIFMAHK